MLPPIRTRTTLAEQPQQPWAQRSSAYSVPDDVFWGTIEQLGGRDVVLARLVADTQWRESATAASLPPVLSLESSQPSTQAGRESAKAPDALHHGHSVGRPIDGSASSGGEESMDVGDGDMAPPSRGCGPASRYVFAGYLCYYTQIVPTVGHVGGVLGHTTAASASERPPPQPQEMPSDVRCCSAIHTCAAVFHHLTPCRTDYVHDAICYNCGSVPQTPQMRRGPCGERTLCNACGSKLLKGTYMHATAQAYPHLYPINHAQRLIYWPGKQTRAEEMAAHAETALCVMDLLRKVCVQATRGSLLTCVHVFVCRGIASNTRSKTQRTRRCCACKTLWHIPRALEGATAAWSWTHRHRRRWRTRLAQRQTRLRMVGRYELWIGCPV